MTQPDQHEMGRAALSELSPRLEEFDQIAASLFSGYDSMQDTPWIVAKRPSYPIAREGLKTWCWKQWPQVRDAAVKHLAEAKRRMMS